MWSGSRNLKACVYKALQVKLFEIFKKNLIFIQFKAYGKKFYIKKIINIDGARHKRQI